MGQDEVEKTQSAGEPTAGGVTPAPAENVAPAPSAETPEDLSGKESEQARAFQAMRQKLKEKEAQIEELRQQLEERKSTETIFDEYQQATYQAGLSQQDAAAASEAGVSVEDFITKDGFVDVERLRRAIGEAKREAREAKALVQQEAARRQQMTIQEQTREALSAYPELDRTSPKFDQEFHNAVRKELTDSMLYPGDYGGRPLTFKEAADRVKKRMGQTNAAQQLAEESVSQKEQAAAEVGTTGRQRQTQQTVEEAETRRRELKIRTRLGDESAIAERLSKLPYKDRSGNWVERS